MNLQTALLSSQFQRRGSRLKTAWYLLSLPGPPVFLPAHASLLLQPFWSGTTPSQGGDHYHAGDKWELAQICRCSLWPWAPLLFFKATAASGEVELAQIFGSSLCGPGPGLKTRQRPTRPGEKQKKLRFVVLALRLWPYLQSRLRPPLWWESSSPTHSGFLLQPLGPQPSTLGVSTAMKSGRCPGSQLALATAPPSPTLCPTKVSAVSAPWENI